MKYCRFLVILYVTLVCGNASASANNFIRETERLIATSDKTYTVVVNQYEQTYSYWTGLNRLLVRVIDSGTNELISEVLLSSVQIDSEMEEPYENSYSKLADELQAFGELLLQPQALYKNLEYPKYRFHIDKLGVYINNDGRQDLLDLSVIESRYAKVGVNISQELDASNLEFTGWYKTKLRGSERFYVVLQSGRHDDDTGGYEYVFRIPNR